ncbi:MAG: exosortase/archaeosortase family protein [Gemmataceae bacterium]
MTDTTSSQTAATMPKGLWAPLAVLTAVLFFSYWTTFRAMEERWRSDPQYSHGYLVPLFAMFLLWSRRDRINWSMTQPTWWGAGLVVAGSVLRLVGIFSYIEWFDDLSLIPTVAGLVLLWGGWAAFRWSWPAIAFLVFMVPLPYSLEGKFAEQLQMLGTRCSTYSLQTIGYPAFSEGTDILINEERMGVVKACSGLGMLMVFFALSVAVALVIRRPLVDRLVIVASAVPIALIANMMRITTTGVLYQLTSNNTVRQAAHDGAGWFMMIFALILMWLELKFLACLIVPEDPRERATVDLLNKPLEPKPASANLKSSRNKKRQPISVAVVMPKAEQSKAR